MADELPDGRVYTGRESGRDGYGVAHGAGADTYGQAAAGQGNWQDADPSGPAESASAGERRPLGQGSEPRARGADAPRPDEATPAPAR